MYSGFFKVPEPLNEVVKTYAPGTPERKEVKAMLAQMRSEEIEVPMVIDGQRIKTDKKVRMAPPHDTKHTLGYFYQGG
ncbi:MAG: 1-pyrroline-5-carboxylate dehydrogenase, partial [Bacteroidales bacterium]|nr:1-pyrroline-5-carboxylate dehydrogenase [Bacteroidales bacterium]